MLRKNLSRRVSLIGTVVTSIGLVAGMASAQETPLTLDPAAFTTVNVTVDGKPLALRRYEVVYVGKPVAMAAEQPARRMGPGGSPSGAETQTLTDLLAYQKLAIFVPETATDSSAIILNVNNGGWFASELKPGIQDGGAYVSNSDTDKAGAALAAGYVYVDVGSRGRGIVAADASYPGKAPAAVVDTKAAIRYLRLNDAALPGSAERIVITGTSGGGGLSSVVAASGNSPDYYPFLAEIGAAGINADGTSSLNDDVFAVIAYCPITDLSHADMAYEWLYQGIRSADNTAGGWSAQAQAASAELAAAYPAYLAGLGLNLADGTPLTTETMKDAIADEVRREVERRIASGAPIPALGEDFTYTMHKGPETIEATAKNTWLAVENGEIKSLDLDAYLAFVTQTAALKTVPAFDRTANTGNQGIDGENSLFGAATLPYSNFSAFGWDHNEVAGDGSGKDDTGQDWATYTAAPDNALAIQTRLINPMNYLGTDAKAAPYWYVRHGMIDRDTSFAVELSLANAARMDADVQSVDFRLPWMTTHSGDYDVTEAYGWLAGVLATAGKP
ncbi:subtype B tannase [Neotabrizicola shimadae]|uniref:Alpha/beta hydrolase fold domain-containing protein n=1 Tax=Neotabrizicola shimadae TaxID=2807096 RepID=A0A8G1EBN5_9RHOB|nr:subtype B tannase [Neotabrizicola shimadae]QYZ69597.1 alpha/beta hydrolase fold domain-containing protein [Neotabrizicola shimadae]